MPNVTDTLAFLQLPQSAKEACPVDPTETELRSMATNLLQRTITEKPGLVESVIKALSRVAAQKRAQLAQQAAIEAGKHYIFATKDKSTTPQHPVYRQDKVFAVDFKEWCKAHDVSEKGMLRVANGEVDFHKGWRQGYHPGNLGIRRAKVIAEQNPHPAGMLVGPVVAIHPTPDKSIWDDNTLAAPTFLLSVVWTPDA